MTGAVEPTAISMVLMPAKEEVLMWTKKQSSYDRYKNDSGFWSESLIGLLLSWVAAWIASFIGWLMGAVLGVIAIFVLALMPAAVRMVFKAVHRANTPSSADHISVSKNGGFRQAGFEKGFLIRPGGSLSSDDLRRRLYQLRTSKGKVNRRSP